MKAFIEELLSRYHYSSNTFYRSLNLYPNRRQFYGMPNSNWIIYDVMNTDRRRQITNSVCDSFFRLRHSATSQSQSSLLIRKFLFSSRAVSSDEDETIDHSLEETYSRKTPLEHILLRPSMYIGPTVRQAPVSSWVLRQDVDSDFIQSVSFEVQSPWLMNRIESSHSPALLKIFDEILVNASDNCLRHPESCDRIDVIIHQGGTEGEKNMKGNRNDEIPNPYSPYISIMNNGKSIPIQIHRKENIYIPELLFGHLLTGSNFNDCQKRLTGGRHGFGAKLSNAFSKQFIVEISDAHSTKGKIKKYKQIWEENMSICQEAEIKSVGNEDRGKGDVEFTRISFSPDLARLTGDPNMTIIPEEEYHLMRRRVVDIAGCFGGKLTVTLNGEVVSVHGFEDYAKLYRSPSEASLQLPPIFYHKLNSRLEVVVGLSEHKSLESVSFVNGMHTSRGGTHVDVIAHQVSNFIADYINSKMVKQLNHSQSQTPTSVSARLVRRHLFLCVNSLIENPSFDSQMKECLTSSPETFGCQYELPLRFLRQLVKPIAITHHDENEFRDDEESLTNMEAKEYNDEGGPGIVEEVLRVAIGAQHVTTLKLLKEINGGKQTNRQFLSIPKLEDANLAGSPNHGTNNPCTLILTEGDSAKALAVAGLEIVGRDTYGIFPLRGKFMNVRNVSLKQLANNEELRNIVAILGLQFGKTYESKEERGELRYGHVMLMTDQDADGSHIKGLIINLFRYYWPALLRPPVNDAEESRSFLSMFITPLLKATKKSNKGESISFYSMSEYNAWRDELESDELLKWSIKYYKGLGTSTPKEAREYFLSFVRHYRPFHWQSEKKDGERIDMVFDKDRADDRKSWILTEYDEKSTLKLDDMNSNSVTYHNFVDCELIHYSNANNIRALPSVVDGLKPSQRKVLYACFKRNLKNEIKVAQLAGYVSEHTAYHHGEASLHATIIGMAQDFCGSNNINLLTPSGQFGTRLMGGKDAASPRYIFTHLSSLARLLFPIEDDTLLRYREEDGEIVEPEYFCPVIPLLLVNGCQGIGTGWSTHIPQHNPLDVLKYIRAKLDEAESSAIRPFVRGFIGAFTVNKSRGEYVTEGVLTVSKSSVVISELPIGVWATDYKRYLIKMLEKGEIKGFSENHTTTTISFHIQVNTAKLHRLKKSDIIAAFNLRNTLSTRNMHAFTTDMKIAKFESAEEIAEAYFPVRLSLYADRKSVLESNMEYLACLMRNKARFIEAVSRNEIDLLHGKRSKQRMTSMLEEMKFSKHSELNAIKMNNNVVKRQQLSKTVSPLRESAEEEDEHGSSREYDYLLNLPLSSLAAEKIEALNEEASKTDLKLKKIREMTALDLWREDLEKLERHLLVFESPLI